MRNFQVRVVGSDLAENTTLLLANSVIVATYPNSINYIFLVLKK
jgi:hypothetical protein